MAALQSNNPFRRDWSLHLDQQNENITAPYSPPRPEAARQLPTRSASEANVIPAGPSRSNSDTVAPLQNRARQPSIVTYRTRSVGGPFSSCVVFERALDLSPPTDDEIIIATVRVTNSFRRASVEGAEELPSRPPPRSFLRRMSTRVSSPIDSNRYTAIKMPRIDYKKYFARDRHGNYAGTEPEREWTQEDLDREFGRYQEMPLRSIPGGQEYGEPYASHVEVDEGRTSPPATVAAEEEAAAASPHPFEATPAQNASSNKKGKSVGVAGPVGAQAGNRKPSVSLGVGKGPKILRQDGMYLFPIGGR